MVIIQSLILPFDHSENDLNLKIVRTLKIKSGDLLSYRIKKRSLDARKGRPIQRVYSIVAEIRDENRVTELVGRSDKLAFFEEERYQAPVLVTSGKFSRPIIIGTGPSGIFAGLILAEAGLRPIMIDRGKEVLQRTRDVNKFWKDGELDPESNVQFGEGGAGTFSDGKLRTRVKDRSYRTNKILEEMIEAGAPAKIIYDHKPHVGTANLVRVVKNIRAKIEELGGEYIFESKVVDLLIEKSKVQGVIIEGGLEYLSDHIVLAIGHSARDTFEMLHSRGIKMAPKPFSVGFRIEHPQDLIDRAQYGKHAGHPVLGAAEYQLAHKTSSGRSVYSFCMCPGGTVIGSSSEPGTVVTNGMSQYARDLDNANSAIVAEVFPDDYGSGALDGFYFQRKWEEKAYQLGGSNYHAPVQLVGDFLSGKPSREIGSVLPTYTPGVRLVNLEHVLPDPFTSAIKEALIYFGTKIPGFLMDDAILTGVETRTSSPLRILREDNFQSVAAKGLYPVGEGSGYAGGIMSSAIDGIKVAEKIIESISQESVS